MSENLATIIENLVKRFDGQTSEFAGETSLFVPVGKIIEAARAIHDEFGFDLLSAVTAVDYWPEENPRFHLYYRFTSIPTRQSLNVRVAIPAISPSAPTLENIYHNANWQEREIYDMFGIKFEGHSDLRRILMPHDWEGHPLRKDYPLGYEEPQFSFNFDEIDVRKPYAKNWRGE
ncbi:MAG: NADH-quinone oxidoreductase subunit C [Chloroflexi bacterium]|nr:NADH-quinone oxidoreductase subunit C [Chloroflexota bacterium]